MLKEKTSNFAYHLQNLENKKQKVFFFFFKLPSIENRLVQSDLFFLNVGFKSVETRFKTLILLFCVCFNKYYYLFKKKKIGSILPSLFNEGHKFRDS